MLLLGDDAEHLINLVLALDTEAMSHRSLHTGLLFFFKVHKEFLRFKIMQWNCKASWACWELWQSCQYLGGIASSVLIPALTRISLGEICSPSHTFLPVFFLNHNQNSPVFCLRFETDSGSLISHKGLLCRGLCICETPQGCSPFLIQSPGRSQWGFHSSHPTRGGEQCWGFGVSLGSWVRLLQQGEPARLRKKSLALWLGQGPGLQTDAYGSVHLLPVAPQAVTFLVCSGLSIWCS